MKFNFIILVILCSLQAVFAAEVALVKQNSKTSDSAEQIDWDKHRQALGHKDKFRILVDKVLSQSTNWVMTEKHMDEIHNAGFNVIVPRLGGDDMARVKRVADMARKRGMFYMAWMRGTLATKTGTKLVWANGTVQDIYSPNANELWDWMTGLILGHARLSVDNPAIVGTFLDFENYAHGKQGNCYELSYDNVILQEFTRAKNLNLPDLPPQQRHAWLTKNGLFDAFREFQISSWRERCRKLRQQIDAINPRFQLTVYPRGPLFLDEAIYPEWSTSDAPLIIAEHSTYGRRGKVVPHNEALELNKDILVKGIQHARSKNVPFMYIGGIDPIVKGADPEFCGKNAVMISQMTNGYWIFYEGPDYHKPDHAAYFKWFSRANHAIMAHKYGLWQQPREEPDPAMAVRDAILRQCCGDTAQPFSKEHMPKDAKNVPCTVRGQGYFAVLLRQGEILTGTLEVKKLGNYTSDAKFSLYGPDRQIIDQGKAAIGPPSKLHYLARMDGVHVMFIDTRWNAAQLNIDNRYFCMIAAPQMGFLGSQPTLYFLPDPGAQRISLILKSPSPAETALVTIFDPNGKQLAQGDTTDSSTSDIKLTITPELKHLPWSLKTSRPPKGTLEDFSLTFESDCVRFLATHPDRLLTKKK